MGITQTTDRNDNALQHARGIESVKTFTAKANQKCRDTKNISQV